MRTVLFLVLSASLLLPPGLCSCPTESLRAAEPAPSECAPPPAKKCGCCQKAEDIAPAPQPPAKKDHAPGCLLVRKLDRVRSVEVAQVIDAPAALTAVDAAGPEGAPISLTLGEIPLRSGGPPRHLLFCTFLF